VDADSRDRCCDYARRLSVAPRIVIRRVGAIGTGHGVGAALNGPQGDQSAVNKEVMKAGMMIKKSGQE
jgi:hypothetical protein